MAKSSVKQDFPVFINMMDNCLVLTLEGRLFHIDSNQGVFTELMVFQNSGEVTSSQKDKF